MEIYKKNARLFCAGLSRFFGAGKAVFGAGEAAGARGMGERQKRRERHGFHTVIPSEGGDQVGGWQKRHGFPGFPGNDGGRGRGAAGVLSPGGSRMAVLESVGDARFVHCAALSFTVIGKRPGG